MKFIQHFIPSAGALLLAAGLTALLGSLAGIGHLHPHDPLLGISMPVLFWIFCGMSLIMVWFCLFGRKLSFQLAIILWFAVNLSVYQIGVLWQSEGGFRAYLQDVAAAFAISPGLVNALLQCLTLYLLAGSVFCLALRWFDQSPRGQAAAARFQTMSCPACGVHIKFARQNLGQKTACPQCGKSVTLHQPEEKLKMSCFFCQGHIEFPPHAIGEKIPCPHCQMDITLKEPA